MDPVKSVPIILQTGKPGDGQCQTFILLTDIASGVNAFTSLDKDTLKITRMDFVQNLASSLVWPHMQRRLEKRRLDRDLSFSIRRMMEEKDPVQQPDDLFMKRKTRAFCPTQCRGAKEDACQKCAVATCLECFKKWCSKCFTTDQ